MTAFLIVALDAITLALPAAEVVQVVRAVAITRLPGCPDAVEGVIDVRGEVLPVYDLRRRFGLAARAVHPDEYLVIAQVHERGAAAIRVTHAHHLREVDPDVVAVAEASRDPVVRGLAQLDDGLLVVCDLAVFLTDLEAAQTAAAIAEHAP